MTKALKNWIYRSYERSPSGFRTGFLDGLDAYTIVWAAPKRFKYTQGSSSAGIGGDWKAVGRDFRSVMRRAGERQ
jgi:hypothetical protein